MKFCECELQSLCRGANFEPSCAYCGGIIFVAMLEDAYQAGTRHEGEYRWGDGGHLPDKWKDGTPVR